MKYIFTKIDNDTTELSYKDKKFNIRRDIDLQKRLQEAIPRARILMNKDLAKMGMTKKDLIIERHEGNKTYYDNSNIMDAEEQYQGTVTLEVYDEIVSKYTQMSLNKLVEDIGLTDEEVEKFGVDLTNAITGKEVVSEDIFPSKIEIEEVK